MTGPRSKTEQPASWATVRLADVVTAPVIYGILQPGPDTSDGVPYIRPTEIQGDRIQSASLRRTTARIAERYRRSSLELGDVILSIVGTIGKVAIVPAELSGANITQSSARLRFASGLSARFAAWALRSPQLKRQYDRARLGTAVPRLNIAHVRDLEIPIAPRSEQHRIVAAIEDLLSRLDEAEAALERVQRNLKRYRAAVLQAAVEGRLVPTEAELARAEARTYEPAAEMLRRIEAHADTSVPAVVPAGWSVARLSDVADVRLGQQRSPVHAAAEVQHRYLRAANITWDGLDLSDVKTMGFHDPERYALAHGDLLLSEASGSPMEAGKPAIWRAELPRVCFQNTVIRVRIHRQDAVLPEYLRLVFLRDCLSGRFAALAPGVGIVHLGAERMAEWRIPLAPTAEQARIIREVARLESVMSETQAEVATAKRRCAVLRQSILKWAFEGRLVDQDPTDEPASVLLERIRAERAAAEENRPRRKKGLDRIVKGGRRSSRAARTMARRRASRGAL